MNTLGPISYDFVANHFSNVETGSASITVAKEAFLVGLYTYVEKPGSGSSSITFPELWDYLTTIRQKDETGVLKSIKVYTRTVTPGTYDIGINISPASDMDFTIVALYDVGGVLDGGVTLYGANTIEASKSYRYTMWVCDTFEPILSEKWSMAPSNDLIKFLRAPDDQNAGLGVFLDVDETTDRTFSVSSSNSSSKRTVHQLSVAASDSWIIKKSTMKQIADAVRAKGGTTEQLSIPDGIVKAVNDIQSGGGASSEFASSPAVVISHLMPNVFVEVK